MKLLLIEDNTALAERIKQHLVSSRYLVDIVSSGEDGLEYVKKVTYSTIILDLGLPGIPGEAVCKKLRDAGVESPILILTGTGETNIKVKLLDTGADDYLTKPFDSGELRARVAALVRRQPLPHRKPLIRYNDIVIDTEERKVYRNETPIQLRRKEFDILEYLIANHGRVLTREMIVNHVWDTSKGDYNSSVDVHIKHLRDKIDRPFAVRYIKTAYGLGYKVDVPT
ncbi:response regulator transcription factor [Candidatus Saccharibacteria bacterium]|nr:response regulator transcription factor [Candidatus Saccharibacteria bacterium]